MACVVGGFECEVLCCADVVVEDVANGFSFSENHAVVAFQVNAELFVHFDAIEDGRRDICQCFHGYAWVEWDFYDERVWDAGVESFWSALWMRSRHRCRIFPGRMSWRMCAFMPVDTSWSNVAVRANRRLCAFDELRRCSDLFGCFASGRLFRMSWNLIVPVFPSNRRLMPVFRRPEKVVFGCGSVTSIFTGQVPKTLRISGIESMDCSPRLHDSCAV